VTLFDSQLERGLVADLLLHNAIDAAQNIDLHPHDFGDPEAALVYDRATRMRDAGHEVSVWTVAGAFEAGGEPDVARSIRGWFSIARDARAMFDLSGGPVDDLVERVALIKHWAGRRRVASIAESVLHMVRGGEGGPAAAAAAMDELVSVGQDRRSIAASVGDGLDRLLAELDHDPVVTPTGIVDLDKALVGGLRPGQLAVIGARPGVGKSSIALGIARHVARGGQSVLFCSLEMPADELRKRLLAAESGVPMTSISAGGLSGAPRQRDRVHAAAERIRELPLVIADTAGQGISGVRREAQRMARRGNLGLIVIDYLQLLLPEGSTNRSRNDEVSVMSRAAKVLALELGVPVLLLSQLNRGVEARQDKRPTLADLRDSGAIEQDADVVMFLHTEEKRAGQVAVTLAKHRNGPLTSLWAAWRAETLQVGGLAHGEGF
jgi:replicative DNA helicase